MECVSTLTTLSRKALKQLISSYPYITPYTYFAELCHAGLFLPSDTAYVHSYNHEDIKNTPDGSLIYCVTERASELYDLLGSINSKISIIFGRSTLSVDNNFLQFFNHRNVANIFAQNCICNDERIMSIPLGIENKNWREDGFPSNDVSLLQQYFSKQSNILTRNYKILAAFSLHTAPKARSYCLKSLLSNPDVYMPRLSTKKRDINSIKDFYEDLINSQYVICPPGAGIDTHRFWQALYLGCKPIILKSQLLPYLDLDIPNDVFVSLDTWDALDSLPNIQSTNRAIFNISSPLYFEYWKQKILCKHNESIKVL